VCAPCRKVANNAEPAPASAKQRWVTLIHEKKGDKARSVCEAWTMSCTKLLAAEGHKCLFNVELLTDQGVVVRPDRGGAVMEEYYEGGVATRALEHLNKSLRMSRSS
jgi:hypothetical protein